MNKRLLFMLCAAVLLVPCTGAEAQYDVPHSVFGGAGGVVSGSHICYHTAGQTGVGVSVGGSYRVKSGFWYLAEISSTVEVAVAAFAGELRDYAVVLTWSLSEPELVVGIHLYRGEGSDGAELERLTDVPLGGDAVSYTDGEAVPGRSYSYQIGVLTGGGREVRSPLVSMELPPRPLTLEQNYPNPFNPATEIAYFLPEREGVELVIYDVTGRRVRALVSGVQAMGRYVVGWNGLNDRGDSVGSGVYYYRLRAGKKIITRKMVLLR